MINERIEALKKDGQITGIRSDIYYQMDKIEKMLQCDRPIMTPANGVGTILDNIWHRMELIRQDLDALSELGEADD